MDDKNGNMTGRIRTIHPAAKLVIFLCVIQTAAVSGGLFSYTFFTILFVLFAALAKVETVELIRKLKPFTLIILSTFIINLIFGSGLELSLKLSLRLMLIILFSSLLTITTKPKDLISVIMYPFGRYAHNLQTVLMVAMEAIPLFVEKVKQTAADIKAMPEYSGAAYKALFKPDLYIQPIIAGMAEMAEATADDVAEGRYHPAPLSKMTTAEIGMSLCAVAAAVFYAL